MCRENRATASARELPWGSSPRVRGKPRGRRPCSRTPRLIPARAGKTSHLSSRPWCPSAHPRVCGENVPEPVNPVAAQGSSPRVRGKRAVSRGCAWHRGLIPACAGKTPRTSTTRTPRRAHPRVCRENQMPVLRALRPGGSSPRVRGKRRVLAWRPRWPGLIPARAGKTAPTTCTCPRTRAHPRACGENVSQGWAVMWWAGSSPRVRGKRGRTVRLSRHGGLIPARAGKTPRGRP